MYGPGVPVGCKSGRKKPFMCGPVFKGLEGIKRLEGLEGLEGWERFRAGKRQT